MDDDEADFVKTFLGGSPAVGSNVNATNGAVVNLTILNVIVKDEKERDSLLDRIRDNA